MKKPNPINRRAVWVSAMVLLAFLGLATQLGNLTLRQRQQYLNISEEQHVRSIPIFAPRGIIYDRNMVPLVTNRPANTVFISYPYYKQPDVLQRLSTILNMPLADIQKLVQQKLDQADYYQPIRVKDDITPQQYSAIVELKNELPGVDIESQPIREYPFKDSAAHVLGYVNQVSQDDLKTLSQQGYTGGDIIGRTGLEAFYESYLRGKNGVRQVEVNNYGLPLGETQEIDPQPGNNLVLTIDSNLQQVAEKALDWDMWRIRNTIIGDGPWKNAKAGAVVALDVKTGAVLAMASRPAFDPNMFAKGITQTELQTLMDPVTTPEVNRAVQSAYQPGSTWKMMTSTAALMNGVIGPYDKVWCNGYFELTGQNDWVKGGHGMEDTVTALRDSCDIYYYTLGWRLGIDRLVAEAKQFLFGQKTGIDIGGENPGMLPDAETRAKLWGSASNPWTLGNTTSAAIGQIVNVTPLQLARYVATLGNNGKIMKPYLVQKVLDPNGNVIKNFAPQQQGTVDIKPEYLQAILAGMHAVDSPGGTSDYAIYPLPGGIVTGGKTGSAQYPPQDDYGFYVSLAPLNDPQIAVAVVIEQGEHGSNTSAVARAIEAAYFHVPLPKYDPANVPPGFPNDMTATRSLYRIVGSGH